jgi:hypothetical protein
MVCAEAQDCVARDARGYDVFISHSSRRNPADHELIDALARALCRRSLKVFVDRFTLEKGTPLLPSLEAVIQQTPVGLAVVTRGALTSGWVTLELEVMRWQRAGGMMRILALRLDPECPVPHGIALGDVIDPPNRNDVADIADIIACRVRAALPNC